MSTQTKKIEVNALREGMFVSDLDRPWHETPFPLQGFYIRQDDDVKAIAQYCRHVYVDIRKERSSGTYGQHTPFNPKQKGASASVEVQDSLKLPPIAIKNPERYEASQTIRKEVARATRLHQNVYEAVEQVFSQVEQGAEPSIEETESVAASMVESVIRNPDALVWLSKMKDKDAHSYQHSVNASIWALVFARHLGLDRKRMKALATGVLLSHIGKAGIDQELLENEEYLEGADLRVYQSYVDHSVDMLQSVEGISQGVLSVVRYHQERHNGSGFPQGVTGDRIPLLAKIAGIVEHYQSLITPREYASGLSPLDAVSVLYGLRNVAFQQDLVERFIEAIGVYPTGTLVELSSAEVGIVTGHNEKRRLMPQVMVVLDEQKQPLRKAKIVDLMEHNSSRSGDGALFIRDSLPKGAYDIDENEYLLTGAKSRWSWQHLAGSLKAG